MKKETKKQLDVIMETYKQRIREIPRSSKQRTEEEKFLNEYKQIQENVILPIMKDIGKYLKENSHCYYISKQEEKITMEIFLNGIDHSEYESGKTIPSISFVMDTSNRIEMRIMIHSCTMLPGKNGFSGPEERRYNADRINDNFVEGKILEVLKEIFK